jgi:hypothetical protein
MFPDTGAAALARRDWGETAFLVADLGSRNTPIEKKISERDQAYLVIAPSAVEVQTVERLCELAGDRPVVLLIPSLWQVYLEEENEYQLIAEETQKPMGEALELLVIKATQPEGNDTGNNSAPPKSGLFASMGRFLRALNQ